MSKVELAYIAGFFDGEGSVGVYPASGKRSHHLRVQLVQNVTPESTELFHELSLKYGGSISTVTKKPTRPTYNWQINSLRAVVFLLDVLPYLRLKQRQAEIALTWQLQRPEVMREKKTGRIKLSSAENVALAERVCRELKLLKKG